MKWNCLQYKFIFIIAGLLVCETLTAQQVSPIQTGHYTVAFSNVRDMAKMAPGLVVLSYNYYAWGDQFVDRNGTKHDKLYLQDIDPDLPAASLDINLKTIATAPAVFWGSTFTLLGGATYVAGVVPVYSWTDVYLIARQGGGNIDTLYTQTERARISGLGDLYVAPLGLSWGWKHFDVTFFYGFTAPTGRYETGADNNNGLGFWTHQFQGFGYWYPYKSQATAFMLGLTYELNTKIKGEDFDPGNRLSLEWGFSQYLGERLEVGVMGGHNWQISDDKGSDVIWDPSIHDRKSTIAFSLAVWPIKNRLYIGGKYMFDFGARQRFLTQGAMLNLIFVTNAMDGVKKQK
jgi:hypothetical protein